MEVWRRVRVLLEKVSFDSFDAGVKLRFFHAYSWSLVASIGSQALNVLASFVVARLLGTEAFGELGIILSTVTMVGVFAGLGLGVTATKFVAQFRRRDDTKVSEIIDVVNSLGLIFSAFFAISLLALANPLSTLVLDAPKLTASVQISTGLIVLNTLIGIQTGILSGFEHFKVIAVSILVRGIFILPLLIAGSWMFGVKGAVGAHVFASILQWGVNERLLQRVYSKNGIKLTRGVKFGLFTKYRAMLKDYSLPALLLNVVVLPANWFMNVLLVNAPNGYVEMGILNAANQWRNAVLFIPTVLSQATVPMLSSLMGGGEGRTTRMIVSISLVAYVAVVIPLVIVLALLNHVILGMYGSSFVKGGRAFVLLVVATGLQVIASPIGQYMTARGAMWLGFIMNVGWGIVFVFVGWFLIVNGFGADGVAIAYLIAYGAHLVWTLTYAKVNSVT